VRAPPCTRPALSVPRSRQLFAQIGFLKAFSDRPETFSVGFAPLQTTLVQLKLREVLILPRCVPSAARPRLT